MVWVAVSCALVFLMQAGFLFLEIGFSREKNAGAGVGKILINLGIVTIAWWAVGYGLSGFGNEVFGNDGFFFHVRPDDRQRRRRVQRRRIGRDADALRARVRGGLAGDRLGNDPGADQVQRLRDLRGRLRRRHLPARRPLGLGRRLPLRRRRQAGDGLRRLVGRPPDRCGRRPRGLAPARRPPRQVRLRRLTACDPRTFDAVRRPRRDDPLDRLVRVQRRLDVRDERIVLRRGDAEHSARRCRRCDRRRPRLLPEDAIARRRHGRQRRDRRPRRDHRAVRVRRVLGGSDHRAARRRLRRLLGDRHRAPPRRSGRGAVGTRHGGDLGNDLGRGSSPRRG